MKDRTYSEQEIAALLERAAELQARTARKADRGPGLTLTELEAIAADAGLDPALLRQAASELDAPGRSLVESSTGTSTTHIFVERWLPGEMAGEAWEDIVAELRHRFDSSLGSMGMPGYGLSSTEQIGRTVEWKLTSFSGIETRVMIRPRSDGTRIRLSQRVGTASSLVESVAYGGILSVVVAAIAGGVGQSVVLAVLVFLAALVVFMPSILYADRAWRRKKHRELEALGDTIVAMAAAPPEGTAARYRDAVDAAPRPSLLDEEALPEQDSPEQDAPEQAPAAARRRARE